MCESADVVHRRVLGGDGAGVGVDVDRPDLAGAELARGDGEDARAGAEVEDARRRPRAQRRLEQHQAAAGAGVVTGAEGHAGIEDDRQPPGRHLADPRRMDEEAIADRQRREVRLPVLRPAGVGDRAGLDPRPRQRRLQLGEPVEVALELGQRRRLGEVGGDARRVAALLRLQARRAVVEKEALDRVDQRRRGGDRDAVQVAGHGAKR